MTVVRKGEKRERTEKNQQYHQRVSSSFHAQNHTESARSPSLSLSLFFLSLSLCCGCCRNRLALFFFQTFLRRFLQRTLSSRFRSSQKGIRFREYRGWKECQLRRVDKCKTSRRPSCWDKSPTPTRSLFRFFVFFVACISARKASAHLQCTNGRAG